MSESLDERELRRQVERRFQKRSELIWHLILFLCVNGMLWLVFKQGFWLTLLTLGWGVGLVGHFIQYMSHYGAWSRSQHDEIEREVQREIARQTGYEKPKNDSRMRLTDDGEIEEVPEDGDEELLAAKPKRAQ